MLEFALAWGLEHMSNLARGGSGGQFDQRNVARATSNRLKVMKNNLILRSEARAEPDRESYRRSNKEMEDLAPRHTAVKRRHLTTPPQSQPVPYARIGAQWLISVEGEGLPAEGVVSGVSR